MNNVDLWHEEALLSMLVSLGNQLFTVLAQVQPTANPRCSTRRFLDILKGLCCSEV